MRVHCAPANPRARPAPAAGLAGRPGLRVVRGAAVLAVALLALRAAPAHGQAPRPLAAPPAPLVPLYDGDHPLVSAAEALREIFPDATSLEAWSWTPDAAHRATLEKRLERPLDGTSWSFLLVFDDASHFLGYALADEQRGKYRPITFMVGVSPDGRVADTVVLVYRESRGGEVRHGRFLSQYRGKRVTDPIRLNRDITNVSGATISVRALNAGVRRVLALVDAAFPDGPPSSGGTRVSVDSLR